MNVDISGLSVTYKNAAGEVKAIDGLDLNVKKGEICAVIGPSGCGKTTLVYVLSGIISDYQGNALLGGEPVNPQNQCIGLIPQNYGLLEWADVYKNITLGVRIRHGRKAGLIREAYMLMSELGIAGTARQYPGFLSGGQRQRAAIARALLMKPCILLMDEPFSALDAITRENVQEMFLKVWRQRPATAIIVTHSIEEALCLGQKIAVMSPSPGRVAYVLENPLFGRKDIRTSCEYYDAVVDLRKKAKALWY